MDSRPIGIFDSGLGGLTVVRQIKKRLPTESIVYLGDTARVPYGTRSKETVTKFAVEDVNFLLKKRVKCIVIACNTASAYSSAVIKRKVSIPVFDAITPAVKEVAKSGFKKVAVIGTRGTIGSHAYNKALTRLDKKMKVIEKACPLFVPAIEENEMGGRLIHLLIDKYLSPLRKTKIDALVLGCTHYPIIKKQISQFMGEKVELVDPAEEMTARLKDYLKENEMMADKSSQATSEYYVTDLTDRFTKVAEMFLGKEIDGKIKKISFEN